MLKLAGWTGTHASDPQVHAMTAYFAEASGYGSATSGDRALRAEQGDGWTCVGHCIARDGDVAVALLGRPVWRTTDRQILAAGSDALAVLRAYRLYDTRFLERLHGSFAVAVIDRRTARTLIAVDRMGIERLAYAVDATGLTFASSTEVVARRPNASPRVRPQALLSYLFFHMIPSPETVFEGVRKVPPATVVLVEGTRVTEETYWRPDFSESPRGPQDSLVPALHDALETGVRAALPDDSTGAFLSGGLDSSTVAGYLGKVTSRPARTFSIGFGFDDYDELRYARIANAHFGCDAGEYVVRPEDIVEQFARIARIYDEPFGNASAVPTYCCARLAREHGVDHLLAGDGGDELFAGNKRYAEQRIFERYGSAPVLLRRWMLEPLLEAAPPALAPRLMRRARNYVAQAKTPLPDRLETWNFLPRLGFGTILDPEFAAAVDCAAPFEHMRAVYASAPRTALVNRMLYYDWRFTLADNDLRKVTTMCELAGVRVSYPMLHPDVVDVSIQVPAEHKMRGTELRTFYRRAMAGFLPQQIIDKTKHGFGLPFGLWLERSADLAELVRGNLTDLRRRGLIRPEFLDELCRRHGAEDARYYGVFIWTLAMLEQWFKEHRLSP